MTNSQEFKSQMTAQVIYNIPSIEVLELRFGTRFVHPNYANITFRSIKACESVSRETHEVTFEYVSLDHDASNEEALIEISDRGIRPALPEELLAYHTKYHKKLEFSVAALGAEAEQSGYPCNAVLHPQYDKRWRPYVLGLHMTDHIYSRGTRFLTVRE